MTPAASSPELLTLHAVRIKGMADDHEVADRYTLAPDLVAELLLDFQAVGLLSRFSFAGTAGWTLTERGRAEDERRLAAELTEHDAAGTVRHVHAAFLGLNGRLLQACTDWQLRPDAADPLAANDHTDQVWDGHILDTLTRLGAELGPLVGRLAGRLSRFGGYDERFAGALERVRGGELSSVTRTRADSCHTVWMELHEDLIATLGLRRGAEPP